MKGAFICLEGICGVGKSSTAGHLANLLGGRMLPLFEDELEVLRPHIDSRANINAHYALYMGIILMASERVRALKESGNTVVLDSYYYRTMAFHRGMGASLDIRLPEDILQPDMGFYLTCDPQLRLSRIKGRLSIREPSKAYWDQLSEERREAIEREYDRFGLVKVDTTGKNPQEVAGEIYQHVCSRFPESAPV